VWNHSQITLAQRPPIEWCAKMSPAATRSDGIVPFMPMTSKSSADSTVVSAFFVLLCALWRLRL
jgi:hypothetical protein